MNAALLAKNIWRFTQNHGSLAARWVSGRYKSCLGDVSYKSSTRSSFIRKGIQKHSDIILNLLKWRIGNGISFDITSSRWELPWNGPKGLFSVADLWNSSENRWSKDMLQGLYGAANFGVLSSMALSLIGLEDKLVWTGHAFGEYSVSAGYK